MFTKKLFLIFYISVMFSTISYSQVRFGLIDAIKNKVEELDKKVTEHKKQTSKVNSELGVVKLEEIYNNLNQGGSYQSSTETIKEANILFEKAIQEDSNNPDANFGYALTQIMLISEDPEVKNALNQFQNQVSTGITFYSSSLETLGLKNLNISVTSIMTGNALKSLTYNAFQNPPAVSEIQKVISDAIIPILNKVIKSLELLENLTSFSITLDIGNQKVEIDKTEIYFLDAYIQLLRIPFCLFVSYNLDVNYDDFKDSTTAKIARENIIKKQGNYVNFLTLKDSSKLSLAGDSFGLLGARSLAGFNSLEAEIDDQSDDIIKKPSTQQIESDTWKKTKNAFQQIYDATKGSITIDFNYYVPSSTSQNLTINLGVIFYNNQIQDLRDKLIPTGTWNYDYTKLNMTDIDADNRIPDFNDPTFNGLLPGMTNINLKKY